MNEIQDTEVWKIYKVTKRIIWQVSNYGRVKRNGKLYKCKPNNCGYLRFSRFYVSRAVAELYVSNPNNYNEVDHIDGNKLNNYYLNLRYCTHKQNCNNPLTTHHLSEESKNRISEANKGEKNGMYGRKGEQHPKYGVHHSHSEESKVKMSAAKTGRSWFLGSDGKRHWI